MHWPNNLLPIGENSGATVERSTRYTEHNVFATVQYWTGFGHWTANPPLRRNQNTPDFLAPRAQGNRPFQTLPIWWQCSWDQLRQRPCRRSWWNCSVVITTTSVFCVRALCAHDTVIEGSSNESNPSPRIAIFRPEGSISLCYLCTDLRYDTTVLNSNSTVQ